MRAIKIEFNLSEAYKGQEEREVIEILHYITKRFEHGGIRADKEDHLPIFDYYNKKIGEVEVVKE